MFGRRQRAMFMSSVGGRRKKSVQIWPQKVYRLSEFCEFAKKFDKVLVVEESLEAWVKCQRNGVKDGTRFAVM